MSEQIKEIKTIITCLDNKLAVDLISNLGRAKDITRTQQSHTFFKRLFHSLKGVSQTKQFLINESLVVSIEDTVELVKEIVGHAEVSHHAILKLTHDLNDVVNGLTDTIEYSVNTRLKLEELKSDVSKKFDYLAEKIERIELMNQSRTEMDRLFVRWKAGKYNNLSILGRVCLVLETLKWGSFGALLKASSALECNLLVEELKDRIIFQIAQDSNVNTNTRLPKAVWLSESEEGYADALSYLCDWAHPVLQPVTFSITQVEEKPALRMPEFFNANKISELLVTENFKGLDK